MLLVFNYLVFHGGAATTSVPEEKARKRWMKWASADLRCEQKHTGRGRDDQSCRICHWSALIYIDVFLKSSDRALSTPNEIVLWGEEFSTMSLSSLNPSAQKRPFLKICADLDWCEFGEVLTACWEREMDPYFSGDGGRYLPLPFENWFFGPVNNSAPDKPLGRTCAEAPCLLCLLNHSLCHVAMTTLSRQPAATLPLLSEVSRLRGVEGKAKSIFSCLTRAAAAEKEIKQHRDWGTEEMARTVKIEQTRQNEMFANHLIKWKRNILPQRWTEMSRPISDVNR